MAKKNVKGKNVARKKAVQPVHKNHSFREAIQFYLIDCKTRPGKFIDLFIIIINLLVCASFVVDTYLISQSTRQFLWNLEVVLVVFFIIEYVARLYGSRNRVKHLFHIYSLIDLVAILPTLLLVLLPASAGYVGFLKIIRVLRVLRIFRFLRFIADPYFFFGNLTWHVLRVTRLVITLLIIFFVSAGLFWHVESPINHTVQNFGDAFYFTVVALTTVGFGDIIPLSEGGKAVTVIMILSGIILIPWQVGGIAREWLHLSDKKRIVCKKCGLRYHDKDASNCKACGHIIYQEFDGD
ncbi:MAG: ion transporter [Nanoarchaeota archaeon]|nr:ion transporter [Nanoarchaeota archaeon]